MVVRDGDSTLVVAELQREFAATEELLVLPAGVVGVGDQPRKPLRDEVDVRVVVGKVIVAVAPADGVVVDDVERPLDR